MLSFDDYEDMGGKLHDEDLFDRLEFAAALRVNVATHGRIRYEVPVRDAVKYCIVALIDQAYEDELNSGREVASQSNNGVSVSFNSSVTAIQRRQSILQQYLRGEYDSYGTPLLYAGVDA